MKKEDIDASKSRQPGLFIGQGWEAFDCWTATDDMLEQSVVGPLFHGAAEES